MTTIGAGHATIGLGHIWHRRNRPTVNEFSYRVNQIWIDPDRPGDLFDGHQLWSHDRRRPIRFKREDYGQDPTCPLGSTVADLLAESPVGRPGGPIRMLTQPRTWGWLFNPITIYLAWDSPNDDPVGAVLEVTNTPWKERLSYAVALDRADGADGGLEARFAKELHVSPFLERHYHYRLMIAQDGETAGTRNLSVSIDVVEPDAERGDPPVVETTLAVELGRPNRRTMTAALYRNPLPTHRVSLGIHLQAARLLRKRVPFVPHQRKKQ